MTSFACLLVTVFYWHNFFGFFSQKNCIILVRFIDFLKRILNQKQNMNFKKKNKTKYQRNLYRKLAGKKLYERKHHIKDNHLLCVFVTIHICLVLFIFDCYRSKKTFMIHSFNWCFCFCFCFEERFFFSKRQQFVCLCRLVCQWNHCRLCSEWMECVIVESNANKQKVFHLLSSLDMMMFIKFFLKSD